jgi:hypothetical protein
MRSCELIEIYATRCQVEPGRASERRERERETEKASVRVVARQGEKVRLGKVEGL